jgi:hypothetical protein
VIKDRRSSTGRDRCVIRRTLCPSRLPVLGLAAGGLLLLASPRPAAAQPARTRSAQADSAPVFVRVLLRRLDALARDTLIRRRTGAETGLKLLAVTSSSRPDALARLDDATLLELVELISESLDRANVSACASIWTQGFGGGFAALGMGMDSTLSERWAAIIEQMVLVSVHDRPIGSMASPGEFEAAIAELAVGMRPDEAARIRRAYEQRAAAAPEDACFLARKIYGWMARLPRERAAAMHRGSMLGGSRAAPARPPE